MVNQMAAPGDVVLVTGGSGFVGRHIVRLLVERGENIAEVRIFDLELPKEDHTSGKSPVRISHVQGDIRDLESLRKACKGVDAIIHSAAALDTSNEADMNFMHSVNVTGTENVVRVCIEESIEHLIHTSSTEVVRTFSERHDATEDQVDDTPVTSAGDLVFPAYSLSKKQGEDRVISANGRQLKNGKRLKSLSLRPCGVYGEGDHKYVTGFLRTGSCMKVMPILGSTDVRIDRVYVGNVAWAHVHALNVVRMDRTRMIGGHAYHITDGTSRENNFSWMKPYLETHRIKVCPIAVPLWLVYYFWFLLEIFVLLLSPVVKIALACNRCELYLGCTTATYNGTRAKISFGYTPLFTAKEAFQRSIGYYSKLQF